MSFAQFGRTHGPIAEVPEDYVPEVLISDDKFVEIYNNREGASKEDMFFARDYAVNQMHVATIKMVIDGYSSTEAVLEEYPKEHLRALFWSLKNCSCCWRHSHHKPIEIDSWENESMLDIATVEMVSRRNCFCHCRMSKRMIRKAFFDCADMPELEEQDTQPADSESEEEV